MLPMCGIFGTTRRDLWHGSVSVVQGHLRHRGPDGTGVWSAPNGSVLLAHTRLAIIGLGDAGAQPASSTDGTVTVSYNGEIYNYRDLSEVGPVASDTHSLCEMLRMGGPTALSQARGMYAAAVWDQRRGTFSAVRDPWGIKPLYLLRHPSGGVTVSSEIPVLLESPDAGEIDPIGLAHYLIHGHTGQTLTLFRHITKVPPGTAISWKQTAEGWAESSEAIDMCPATNHDGFGDAIVDSVRAHLVADVEVGVFLSAGLDSTLLAAVASDLAPAVRTFTLAFPDDPELDESSLAEANARSLGVKFNPVPVTIGAMTTAADRLLRIHGEPLGDAAVLPLSCLATAAADEVKVVLAGEGADEIFGGYGRYRVSSILQRRAVRMTGPLGRLMAGRWARRRTDRPRDRAIEAVLWGGGPRSHGALLGSEAGWMTRTDLPLSADVERVVHAEWATLSTGGGELEQARAYDLRRWLPNVYLEKTDRATMASSLEARVPYLDPAVASMPRAMTTPPKALIRDELLRRLPSACFPVRKKGLAVPLPSLLNGALGDAGRYELESPGSVLARVAGPPWQVALTMRAQRSPTMAFRLAMLGRWDQLFSDRIRIG